MNCVLTIKTDLFYINNISLLLDRYRKKHISGFRHYIFHKDTEVGYAIRYPGHTVGFIYTNDKMIITKIVIATDKFTESHYSNIKELRFKLSSFIDAKLIILTDEYLPEIEDIKLERIDDNDN